MATAEPKRRVDTRSVLAILVVLNILILTAWLAYSAPESDGFKILLGLLGGSASGVVGYYFGSNSSSEKKDDQQARVAERLAAKVTGDDPIIKWWDLMSEEEKAKITEAGKIDGTIQTFVTTAAKGRATPEDLAYLVKAGLLTQERADAIQSA